jgi:hypothetical protein
MTRSGHHEASRREGRTETRLTVSGLVCGSLVLLVSSTTACGQADAAAKAFVVRPGSSVAELIAAAGQPTEERILKEPVHSGDVCGADKANVRALEYHVPSSPIVRQLYGLVGTAVSSMTVVCVDSSGRVTKTHMIQH